MIYKVPHLLESLLQIETESLSEFQSRVVEGTNLDEGMVFKILVWNIYKGRKSQFQKDLAHLAHNKDFLLLQEVIHRAGSSHFHSPVLSTYQWRIGLSFQVPALGYGTGVALGSHFRAKETELVRTNHREWHLWTPKTAMISRFKVGQYDLLVVNCHAINFVVNKNYLEAMNFLAEKLSTHQGPLLVAGDFNTWNRIRWDGLKSILKNLRLEPVDLDGDRRWLKLDHIFVRDLRVHRAEVVHGVQGSDHLPILFEFSFL